MVHFTRKIMANGLHVLVHEDKNTPLVAINMLYKVGSRDELSDKTGFAHLFEHLMFSGSRNAPDFDDPLQRAGGENNAYTTNDYTTFYEILPAENLETGLWLESDRMLALKITKKALNVQRRVVVEEFMETCLNEPYGDAWHHLSDLMFKKHPYRWPVIGLVPEHVKNATIEDVRDFYQQWYTPNNAVLSIAGNVDTPEVLAMVDKWFSGIPKGPEVNRNIPPEPLQKDLQKRVVHAKVPVPAVYLVFRTPPRIEHEFYPVDLLSDILAHGQSSRLYRRLVKEKQVFSSIDAYVTANLDQGLLIIEGKPTEGTQPEDALAAIWEELNKLKESPVDARELAKIQNRFESTVVFSETSILNKAQNLAFYEMLDRAETMNEEVTFYQNLIPENLHKTAQTLFQEKNSAVLMYLPE